MRSWMTNVRRFHEGPVTSWIFLSRFACKGCAWCWMIANTATFCFCAILVCSVWSPSGCGWISDSPRGVAACASSGMSAWSTDHNIGHGHVVRIVTQSGRFPLALGNCLDRKGADPRLGSLQCILRLSGLNAHQFQCLAVHPTKPRGW